MGYGVWALVWSSLITGAVGVIARWFIIAWRPKFMFSFQRLKPLFSYGWKMAVSGLLDATFRNVNGLIIGKLYSKADLAYVKKGYSLPSLAMNEVDATLGRVSFPALVLLKDDKVRLREAIRRMIKCSTFLVFPIMTGIAACSYSLLRLLYGSQWTPAAPYMMLACFTFALWPFHTINLKGIMALGRSDVFLKLEVIKKTLTVVVLLSTFRLGVLRWMVISAIVLGPLSVVINSWPNRKLLGYTIGMQLRDVMPTALVCIFEAAVVFGIDFACDACAPMFGVGDAGVRLNVFLACKLMLQFIFGAGIFFGLSYAFKLNPMGEYARMAAGVMKGRFPRIFAALERRFVK
jgi:O-antigen/teichoic acid export membrane protein